MKEECLAEVDQRPGHSQQSLCITPTDSSTNTNKPGQNAGILFSEIGKNERFKIETFESGAHIVKLTIAKTNLEKFKESLGKKNVILSNPVNGGFMLKVNPSINGENPQNLAGYFLESLKEASV